MSEALCQCGHPKVAHLTYLYRCFDCECKAFYPTPPPTREPIRLTAEERAKFFKMLADYKRNWITTSNAVQAVESILAARLAGGPTLADARTPIAQEIEATVWRDGHGKPCTPFDEGKAAAARIARGNYIADDRTPESEDTE